MTHYNPQGRYQVNTPSGDKLGELVKGSYYETHFDTPVGEVRGEQFFYNGSIAGRLEGLTIVREDDGSVFELVAQEEP